MPLNNITHSYKIDHVGEFEGKILKHYYSRISYDFLYHFHAHTMVGFAEHYVGYKIDSPISMNTGEVISTQATRDICILIRPILLDSISKGIRVPKLNCELGMNWRGTFMTLWHAIRSLTPLLVNFSKHYLRYSKCSTSFDFGLPTVGISQTRIYKRGKNIRDI